jgi:hypothetical protein
VPAAVARDAVDPAARGEDDVVSVKTIEPSGVCVTPSSVALPGLISADSAGPPSPLNPP